MRACQRQALIRWQYVFDLAELKCITDKNRVNKVKLIAFAQNTAIQK